MSKHQLRISALPSSRIILPSSVWSLSALNAETAKPSAPIISAYAELMTLRQRVISLSALTAGSAPMFARQTALPKK